MKILLCCTSIQDEHRSDDNEDSHYPLGLAYLQSYIEHHRSDKDEFRNLYLNNVDYETCYREVKKNLKEMDPDVFGVSIMTHSRVSAYRMIEYAHENYPNTKIVVGGMHVSVMWRQMVKKYPYIVAVRGEGETCFHDLIEAYDNETSLEDVKGIAYHNGEKIVVTAERDLIPDIDVLPFPKHELFVKEGKTMANLLTSRGCPYKCNFCVLDHTSRRKVRFRSGENIADEVEMLLEKFPSINAIWIHDDAFMINKDRTIEFCDAIINRGIKTSFVASARFRPISPEVVRKMELAGFCHVLFGLESGADDVIRGMRKGITKQHVRYGMSLFANTTMRATAFLIAGLPGETDETIEETIEFVQEIQNIDYLYYEDIGISMIYPGTEMYTMARATGKINDDYWLTDADVPYYIAEHGGVHTYEKLLEMKERIEEGVALRFMLAPKGFLHQRKVIPSLIKYSLLHRMPESINDIVFSTLARHPQLLKELIRGAIIGDTKAEITKELAKAFERTLAEMVMKRANLTSETRRKVFISQCYAQECTDDILLKAQKQRLEEVIFKLSDQDDQGDIAYDKNVRAPASLPSVMRINK